MKCPVVIGAMEEPGGSGGYRPVAIRAIEIDRLKVLLEDPTSSFLLIDSRPFLSFNNGHIQTAHNVYCPPILRRRYEKNVPFETILGLADSRDLIEGRYGMVVVYDDSTYLEDGLLEDDLAAVSSSKTSTTKHDLLLVLRSLIHVLSKSSENVTLQYLNGGFDKFSKTCQHLIRSKVIAKAPASAVPLPSDSVGNVDVSYAKCNFHCGPKRNKLCLVSQAENIVLGNSSDTVKCHSSNDRGDPVEILPWLYLGNAYHASQEHNLKELGVFALLNVAERADTSDDLASVSSTRFCHMNLPIADSSTSDISCKFPQAIEFIEKVHQSGGKVLVHCVAGISRSPTICIAYLMYSRDMSLDQAYDFIKQKRSLISPNLNFMQQLAEYERSLTAELRSTVVNDCAFDGRSSNALQPATHLSRPLLQQAADAANVHLLSANKSKLNLGTDDSKTVNCGNNAAAIVASNPRKRPRPESLSFSISCSGKPLKSVPYTPCTKQAIFTFDFPSVAVLTSSPTVSHSPLLSPS